MKSFRVIGLIGLSITVLLNGAALVIFKRTSAEFFSPSWWSVWFPNYLVWSVFTIAGFASDRIKPQ